MTEAAPSHFLVIRGYELTAPRPRHPITVWYHLSGGNSTTRKAQTWVRGHYQWDNDGGYHSTGDVQARNWLCHRGRLELRHSGSHLDSYWCVNMMISILIYTSVAGQPLSSWPVWRREMRGWSWHTADTTESSSSRSRWCVICIVILCHVIILVFMFWW